MQLSFPSSPITSAWSSATQRASSQTASAGSVGSSTSAGFAQALSGLPPGGPPPGPPPDGAPESSDSSGNGWGSSAGSGGLSTLQFAQRSSGSQAPNDPIASLDTNNDDSVSADEFGLSSASSDVKKLFAAIDTDGSGALSKSEVTSFRDKMVAAMQASDGAAGTGASGGAQGVHHHPGGPPPDGDGDGDGPSTSTASTASTAKRSSTGSSSSTSADQLVKQMLAMVAQRYGELSSSSSSSTTTASVFSTTA
jgi:hypothetical protein